LLGLIVQKWKKWILIIGTSLIGANLITFGIEIIPFVGGVENMQMDIQYLNNN